jgi:hypothetical protein
MRHDAPENARPHSPADLWASSANPVELLDMMRLSLGEAFLSRHARELRLFACWCARQRSPRPGSSLVELAEWYANGDFNTAEVDALRGANVPLANAASSTGLLHSGTRVGAAAFLAAFHALNANAFDAAMQASRVVERYAAENELDARFIRAEQAAQLRELFGAPFTNAPTASEPAPPMAVPAWQDSGLWATTQAGLLRQLYALRAELLSIDPWIPLPGAACALAFGASGSALPIGALFHLWEHWPAAGGPCPGCGGRALALSVGGTSGRNGVVRGCCLVCERELLREFGTLHEIADSMRPALAGTPYAAIRLLTEPTPATTDDSRLSEALGEINTARLLGGVQRR